MKIGLIKWFFQRSNAISAGIKAHRESNPSLDLSKDKLEQRVTAIYTALHGDKGKWFAESEKSAIRSTLKQALRKDSVGTIAKLVAETAKTDNVYEFSEVEYQKLERTYPNLPREVIKAVIQNRAIIQFYLEGKNILFHENGNTLSAANHPKLPKRVCKFFMGKFAALESHENKEPAKTNAKELNRIGYNGKNSSKVDRPSLFKELQCIPDEEAAKILDWLKNPQEINLSNVEKSYILLLYRTLGCNLSITDCKEEQKILKNDKDELQKHLLPRKGCENPNLDFQILEELFRLKFLAFSGVENNHFLKLYHSFAIKNLENVSNKDYSHGINDLINSDILEQNGTAHDLLNRQEIQDDLIPKSDDDLDEGILQQRRDEAKEALIANLPPELLTVELVQAFEQEATRSIESTFKIGKSETIIIPAYSDTPLVEISMPLKVNGNSPTQIRVPVHIALLKHMKEIAGNDKPLLLQLQSLSAQTVFNYIHFLLSQEMLTTMGISIDQAIIMMQLKADPVKRCLSINDSRNEITFRTDGKLKVADASALRANGYDGKTEIAFGFSFEIKLVKTQTAEGEKWIARSPTFGDGQSQESRSNLAPIKVNEEVHESSTKENKLETVS